jgi:hypothetical protein
VVWHFFLPFRKYKDMNDCKEDNLLDFSYTPISPCHLEISMKINCLSLSSMFSVGGILCFGGYERMSLLFFSLLCCIVTTETIHKLFII